MSDRTSTSITANTVTLLSRLIHGDVGPMVRGPSTHSPADALEGRRLVIVNTPWTVYKEAGRAIQMAWKLSAQRECLRRDLQRFSFPVALVQDEFQILTVGDVDSQFQATCRSMRCAVIAATQNFPGLHKALGSKEDAQAIVGNFQCLVMGNNSCPVTNEMASKIIGQSRQMFFGGSGGGRRGEYSMVEDMLGTREPSGGMSFNEQLAYDVPPESFGKLATGGGRNAGIVEVFVYLGGRKLSNGRNWMKASIRQRGR